MSGLKAATDLNGQIAALCAGIREAAEQIAPDYPNVSKCDSWEQLYAIKASYKGTCDANEDLHRLVNILREKLGMSNG